MSVLPDVATAYVPRLLLDVPSREPSHWAVDGTLMFADISGFTRLTERLSRQGKAGAEELVTTISRVFTELLTASEHGDVLKFGGDALLLLYTGPEHQVRACAAAQSMQRTLRRVGAIDSSQGRVRLRMSVGIHSARIPFFLAGDGDALELFVLGPAATRLVDIEGAAEAGEILVSDETATALPPAWLAGRRGDASLVRRVPAHLPWDPPPQPAHGEGATVFVPKLLRGRLGGDLHEHRRVATSFVHVGGVDRLLQDHGPDQVLTRIDALTRRVMEVCDELGILLVTTDIGADGGKYMLTAGAPDASEDDEGRLLRGVRRIVTADVGLPVRAGVNHGHVFAGDVGAPFRRTYSTMGDPVNLAARLMGKSPPGRVLATRSVVESAAGRFETEPVPPFLVKGKAKPIDAVLVGAARTATTEDRQDRDPLVGRDRELARLRTALERALTGEGHVIEIVGELGVGKSRLIAELARERPDVSWVRVTGDAYEARSPFHVAGSLLRTLLRLPAPADRAALGEALTAVVQRRAPQLAAWLPLLAVVVGADVPMTAEVERTDQRFRRRRMHAAVGELLAAAVGAGVVVIDGAEHVDDASADLLHDVLTDVLTDRPWLVLLSRRAGTDGHGLAATPEGEVLRLGPLPDVAQRQLLRSASLRYPLPDHALDAIQARADGNPLFLIELARSAAEAGTIDALPGSVESILASRLDGLPEIDRRALRELAVIGDRATPRIVDHVLVDLGVSGSDPGFWRRLAEHVDWSPEGLRFRHRLVREVAYEGLTYRRRRVLHGRVADEMLARGDADWSLSWHLAQAGRWDEAWAAAVAAGDQASTAYANVEAAAFYRRALEAAANLPGLSSADRASVAERCGDAEELAGLFEGAAAAYGEARRFAAAPEDALRLVRKRGVTEERLGRYTSALRWYGRGLASASADEASPSVEAALAQLQVAYAGVLLRQGRLHPSVRRARLAAERAERAGDRATLAHAFYLLDAALTDLGDEAGAAGYRDRALPIFEQLGDLIGQANVLNNLGVNAYFAGRYDEALAYYTRSREAREAAGDVVGAATADHNIAELLLEQGDLDGAETLLEDALRVSRGARYALGVAYATSNLGSIAAQRGEHEIAVERLRSALEGFEELGAGAFLAETCLRLATSLAALGRWVEVWDVALRAEQDDQADVRAAARRLRVQALEATGSVDRAAALAAEAGSVAPTPAGG